MTRTPTFTSPRQAGRKISPPVTPLSALSIAAALTLGVMATDANALALGRMNVQSALGEPLRAEIEVTDLRPGEADGLRVELASQAAFQAAGVTYNAALSNVQATLQRRADGRYVVRLSGTRPMNEPFVDLLLEAQSSSGRIVRDYTLLLDPPRSTRQAAAAAKPVTPTAPQVVSPQARVAASPAPSAAVRSAAAPAASNTGGQQVTVQRGDTLGRIAAAHKPADVSLDQMLVALLRANPDAFIGGNVNRIKAGAVLQVPSASEAASTPADEARRTVMAQSRDFSQYRRRLAENAPTSQVADADRQASGRLQANVQDRSAAATTPDRLTLAQGAAAARNEERIAKTRQAEEAASRVGELQRNVEDLKRLQNGSAAPAVAPAASSSAAQPAPAPTATPASPPAATPPAAPTSAPAPAAVPPVVPGPVIQASPPVAAPVAPTTPAVAPVAPAEAPAAAAPTPTPTPAPATDAPAAAAETPSAAATPEATAPVAAPVPPAPAPRPNVAPPPPPEPSLLDQIMANPLIPAGGAIALLLLGFLGYRMRGRKKADAQDSVFPESKLPKDSFFGATGGESVDTSSRNNSVVSSLSYSPSQLDAGDVDPVAEADVYLAYGRDLQAEEILREALRTTPERAAIHLKLLEIHAKRRDLRAFEMLAGDVRKLTNGSGPDWSRVLDMGRELDPGNPLYQGSAAVVDNEKTVPIVAAATAAAAVSAVAPAEPPVPFVPSVAPLDFDLDLGKPTVATTPAPLAASPVQAPSFEPSRAPDYAVTARSPLLDEHLDNDFETAPGELDALSRLDTMDMPRQTRDTIEPATLQAGPPSDSGFIEFDMSAISGLREPSPAAETAATTVSGDLSASATDSDSPLAIKLSLARELHALGDAEGARSLLEEVASESSGDLKAQAQQLLSELS